MKVAGLDQRVVDLNLRPEGAIGSDSFTLTGRTRIDPSTVSPDAINIVFIGQSTNNNSVKDGTITPAHPNDVFNLSIAHKGALFLAKAPLLASDLVLDHHGRILADKIIDAGLAPQVVLTMAAFGGSYCADWAPGGGTAGATNYAGGPSRSGLLAYRVGLAQRCIAQAGLDHLRTIVDWQQGEWDSDNPNTTQSNYATALGKVIAEARKTGLLRSGRFMVVHRCTRPSAASSGKAAIRAGQAQVCDGAQVRLGADIDTIGSGSRYDGTHLSVAGATTQASLKLDVYRQLPF